MQAKEGDIEIDSQVRENRKQGIEGRKDKRREEERRVCRHGCQNGCYHAIKDKKESEEQTHNS